MSRHLNYPESAHALTLTHACRSLVFFLVFGSIDSILNRAISLSTSRASSNHSWRKYARRFHITHIDGQRRRLVFIQPCPASASFPPSRMMIIFSEAFFRNSSSSSNVPLNLFCFYSSSFSLTIPFFTKEPMKN